jgi:hypothetical protein
MTKRRSFSDKFKATVALEALRGDKTAQEIAAKHKVHPTQVTTWKREAIDGLTGVFTKYPFFGSRQIAAYLPRNWFRAGRHRVRRRMGIMGLQAI